MAYGETFEVGDRVGLENVGYWSFGTVAKKRGGDYVIKWDDGFSDVLHEDGTEYTYDSDDLTAEANAEDDLPTSSSPVES